MLTNFDNVDFNVLIKLFQDAATIHSEEDLHCEIGLVARENANDDSEPDLTVGYQLRNQYENMNDEQRKGFDAALIALTGLCYETLIREAIRNLGENNESL
jgi:hypothetical protein